MTTYRFTLSEHELELVLGALSLVIEANADKDTTAMARALLVRLDTEADAQFAPA